MMVYSSISLIMFRDRILNRMRTSSYLLFVSRSHFGTKCKCSRLVPFAVGECPGNKCSLLVKNSTLFTSIKTFGTENIYSCMNRLSFIKLSPFFFMKTKRLAQSQPQVFVLNSPGSSQLWEPLV